MKALFRVIGLLSLLAVVACHSPRREARRMVDQAERLLDSYPDSTVLLVDSVLRMEVFLPERYRMEMALLQGEALLRDVALDEDDLEKELTPVAPSLELEHAAAYFAKKKEYSKASHAALYSGYVQQYYNEKEAAMQSYKDAEQYGSLAGEDYIVAKARCRMGRMLFGEYLYDDALLAFKQAELGLGDRSEERARVKNMVAVTYILRHQYDSAEMCLSEILPLAEQERSSWLRYKVLNNYSVLYSKKKEYELAMNSLRQISKECAMDDEELFLYYLNMGKIHMALGSTDSAEYYCQRMEDIMPHISLKKETSMTAYSVLVRVAKAMGNESLAFQYKEKHEDLLFELLKQHQEQQVYHIRQQYDYEKLQNKMHVKQAYTQRIIAIILVLILGVFVFVLYRSAQRNRKEAEINADLFRFMEQNEELKHRQEVYIQEGMERSRLFSELLEDKVKFMMKLDYYLSNQGDKRPLNELEKEVFGGQKHLDVINQEIDALYPGLRDTLKAKYPQLSELECEVYLLSRFKLSRAEEADLLEVSTSVIDKARGKVHRINSNA